MPLVLPNPTVPTNGQPLDATPVLANILAIAQAIQSFDGSQIQAGTIAAAAFNANINPNTVTSETESPFVSSGVVWSVVSGLNGTMSGGVIYINGIRVPINAVASNAFAASKDTYIDIDVNGNITYQAVTTGATAPAIGANSIRVAAVIAGVAAITTIQTSGFDSLGNRIRFSGPITGSNAPGMWWEEIGRATLITAGNVLSIPVLPPRKYLKILFSAQGVGGTISAGFRYNNDSGSNYSYRQSDNGAADVTSINSNLNLVTGAATYANLTFIGEMINIQNQEKIMYGVRIPPSNAGAGSPPDKSEQSHKWANTAAQVTAISTTNTGGGQYGVGSELVVLGHN